MTSSGGAWEVVVDKAALEVSRFLAAATDPFLPDSRTARWMLALLDASSLRDVLEERNDGGRCGMIGCPAGRGAESRRHGDGGCERRPAGAACGGGGGDEGDEWAGEEAGAFRRYERYRAQQPRRAAAAAGRFCSPACAEAFEALAQKIPPSLVYARGEVVQAVGGLFPNMSLAALQRLAGAESTSVADIAERRVRQEEDEGPRPPPLHPSDRTAAEAASLREALSGIAAERETWRREMRQVQATGADEGRRRRLPLPLMVYDWCMTMSTARTKALFATLCRRGDLSSGVWSDTEHGAGRDRSLYVKCVGSIRSRCLRRAEAAAGVEEAEPPSVDPQLQQQRLALFAAQVFSAETTAALSRLLLYDEATLQQAWELWRLSGLLATLQFPFALPGALVAGGAAPHVLFLALVMLAAAGLCGAAAWAEWMREDALGELLAALGATAEELAACVQVLVLE
ncbi:uncharacterized protein Tco025E_05533 [Trypanosoma conorhini]|uniref:RTR1-type domain-containing protein n=1 Tax=Trypanosoma conorhini TaxID=83891 RepID=A0A3R7KUD4_9TRYP|nr:uncharacterized protein Tco025E_05533 [Trypanosoma conorhini]RNF15430.1 hypothetical protein Tco025E_05533 [Trypanosoma conorhini]